MCKLISHAFEFYIFIPAFDVWYLFKLVVPLRRGGGRQEDTELNPVRIYIARNSSADSIARSLFSECVWAENGNGLLKVSAIERIRASLKARDRYRRALHCKWQSHCRSPYLIGGETSIPLDTAQICVRGYPQLFPPVLQTSASQMRTIERRPQLFAVRPLHTERISFDYKISSIEYKYLTFAFPLLCLQQLLYCEFIAAENTIFILPISYFNCGMWQFVKSNICKICTSQKFLYYSRIYSNQ